MKRLSDKYKWAIILFLTGLGLGLIFSALKRDVSIEAQVETVLAKGETGTGVISEDEASNSKYLNSDQGELNSNREPNLNLTDDLRPALEKGPYVAIVVDDLGFSYARAKELSRIDLPLTWAIIPFQSASRQTADLAKEKGIPFLVHIPMQAFGDKDGGAYLVGLSMGDEEIKRNVKRAIESLPGAIGANNHRGSAATSDMRVMRAAMEGLKETGLSIFLDSRTAASSVAAFEAKRAGLLALENGAFIDHLDDVNFMWSQLRRAAGLAKRRGYIVAICHVRPATLVFLNQLASNPDAGVKFVTLEELACLLSASR
ncbi:divergent polysaccharide deacetylase family protein [Acetomicrobium sp.]|uniref:divergent polysaccharide deacetylase family protein n=1 Tax=Acetomicrobium sp. TaxID=1872099 RepID=UPI003D9646C5